MASLATQNVLNSFTDKFNGKTPTRVYFLDNSSKVFLVDYSSTVQDLLILILEKYSIQYDDNLPYYGLFESLNGSSISGGSVSMDAIVTDVVDAWADQGVKEAKFVFMIRLYLPCITGLQLKDVVGHRLSKPANSLDMATYLESAEMIDPNMLHLQYIQAVYNVITGRYPTTKEQAIALGATQFLFKFGEYKADIHQPGFLGNRIVELIPIKHLKSGSEESIEEWEELLLRKVIEMTTDSSNQRVMDSSDEKGFVTNKNSYLRNGHIITPQRQYMEMVLQMPMYGNIHFKCKQNSTRQLPDSLFVTIHHSGISLMDKSKNIITKFHIEEIFRWGFKPGLSFNFEIDSNNDLKTGNLDFDTDEGKLMSDLLTDYAMSYLKEKEREEQRFNRMKSGEIVSSIKIGEDIDKVNASATEKLDTKSKDKYRRMSASKKFANKNNKGEDVEEAVTKLQALYRGHSLRADWQREEAAILLQSVIRGYLARIKVSIMIEELLEKY